MAEEYIINKKRVTVERNEKDELELISVWKQLGLPEEKHPVLWAHPGGIPGISMEKILRGDYEANIYASPVASVVYFEWVFGYGLGDVCIHKIDPSFNLPLQGNICEDPV